MLAIDDILLGAAIQTLLAAINEAHKNSVIFRKKLERLQETVKKLEPKIIEILKHEAAQPYHFDELKEQLDKATELFKLYAGLHRRHFRKRHEAKQLIEEFDAYLQQFMTVNIQVMEAHLLLKMYSDMREFRQRVDLVLETILLTEPNQTNVGEGSQGGVPPASSSSFFRVCFENGEKKFSFHLEKMKRKKKRV